MAPLPREKVSLNLSSRVAQYFNKFEEPEIEKPVIEDPAYQGRYDNRTEYAVLTSFFRTPFTDIFDGMLSYQGYGLCGELEAQFMNCLEAYGIPQGYKKCRLLSEDYFECATRHKQNQRNEEMRNERRRQYYFGERKIKYAVPPKLGSYAI